MVDWTTFQTPRQEKAERTTIPLCPAHSGLVANSSRTLVRSWCVAPPSFGKRQRQTRPSFNPNERSWTLRSLYLVFVGGICRRHYRGGRYTVTDWYRGWNSYIPTKREDPDHLRPPPPQPLTATLDIQNILPGTTCQGTRDHGLSPFTLHHSPSGAHPSIPSDPSNSSNQAKHLNKFRPHCGFNQQPCLIIV